MESDDSDNTHITLTTDKSGTAELNLLDDDYLNVTFSNYYQD
jgi:hypothetical protein